MGWSIGYSEKHKRFIGYGVPAECDHPECKKKIYRGLSYICGADIYGGDHGCGLFFCSDHLGYLDLDDDSVHSDLICDRCKDPDLDEFEPKTDVKQWRDHLLTDPSWDDWRKENPEELANLQKQGVKDMVNEGALF